MNLSLGNLDLPDCPDWVLSVDGMAAQGPNLSHWPGNRTPTEFKADLSTGICLRFAKASQEVQRDFLGDARLAVNDHYDTDGFLSLLCVLHPEIALAREDVLLEAAATGDYQSFQSRRGFAIDRIVLNLAAPHSPVRHHFEGLAGPAKDFARYQWLLDHAIEVLDDFETFAVLYQEELDLVEHQLQDPSIVCQRATNSQLACVTSAAPIHRMALNSHAGSCYRVLHTQLENQAPHYRFHDRTENWFEVQSFSPAPRRNLRPLVETLTDLEPAKADAQWSCDPINEPVPELYYGVPSAQAYGQITRILKPSRLMHEQVETLFAEFFA